MTKQDENMSVQILVTEYQKALSGYLQENIELKTLLRQAQQREMQMAEQLTALMPQAGNTDSEIIEA